MDKQYKVILKKSFVGTFIEIEKDLVAPDIDYVATDDKECT